VGASGTAQKNLGYIYLSTGLDPSIKTLPLSYEQIVMNGMNALQTKDYDSAMYFFNEAYAQNPTDTRVLNSLGTIYTDTGSFNNAEQLLEESLTINDKNAETYYVLGYLAFKKGNKASAIENLQQALKLNPEHNAAKTNLNILLDTQ
jgi:Flp pilus assembly protein TadD